MHDCATSRTLSRRASERKGALSYLYSPKRRAIRYVTSSRNFTTRLHEFMNYRKIAKRLRLASLCIYPIPRFSRDTRCTSGRSALSSEYLKYLDQRERFTKSLATSFRPDKPRASINMQSKRNRFAGSILIGVRFRPAPGRWFRYSNFV
jgi:hypothetical protein